MLLLFVSSKGIGQFKFGDQLLGATIDYIDFQGFSPKTAFGISGEYMLGKHVGIEASIAAGKDYLHFGPALFMVPLTLLLSKTKEDENKDKELLIFLATGLSFFEQTNYHIHLSSNFELIPFLSILRFRYIYDEYHQHNDDSFVSWSIGTKLSLLTKNNWYINASIERSQLYYSGVPSGIQTGIHAGYIFKSKDE